MGAIFLLQKNEAYGNLNCQDGGDAQIEFGMAGFVAAGIHPQPGADAAAQGSDGEEGGLGNPPALFAGLFLVYVHKQETQRIDYKQIEENKFFHVNAFQGGIFVKKWGIFLILAILLTGCAPEETMETVSDGYTPWELPVGEIVLELPADAAAPVLEDSRGATLYDCGDYEILVEVCPGGSLDRTVAQLTGLGPDRVELLKTRAGEMDRYDFTWCAAGEQGTVLGRGAILDDGSSHYCLSVLAAEELSGSVQDSWKTLFHSFSVSAY